MKKWKGVSFIAMPACVCLGAWSFMNQEHHHPAERPAYSYLNIRNKIMPWGGKCGLFEYGKCQEPDDE
jgi:cytochrome c oxidase subunit 6a